MDIFFNNCHYISNYSYNKYYRKNNKKNKFETKYEIIKNMNGVVDSDTIKVIGKLDDVEFVFSFQWKNNSY